MIRDLETEIMSVLATVPGVKIYDYEPKVLEAMPAITLRYIGFTQTWRSFGKHDVTYTWDINVYVGVGNDAKQSKYSTIDLANQVINAFRLNPTLNDKARVANIISGSMEVVTDVQRPYYLHTLRLEAVEEEI